ncbi:MAG: SH3 domain-containing protein [Desulfobacterales bacterium]
MIKLKPSFMIFLLIGLNAFPAFAVEQKTMSIQVKKGEIRSTPSFLGVIVARVSYGDRVYVREEKGSWVKVRTAEHNSEGWIHSSALTLKKIVFNAGAADVQTSASSNELALAGKGFNEQVENEFKEQNPKINYAWVNRMEKFVVSEKEIKQFLKEGKLTPEGGF